MTVDIQCVAHLHGGPCDGTQFDLSWARHELGIQVWDDTNTIDGCTTAVYRIRGPYLLQPVAHYDYVQPAARTITYTARVGGLRGWLQNLLARET